MKKILLAFGISIYGNSALAVRPFITDDARVAGLRYAQLESWLRYDKHALQQWNMIAYGPVTWLEITTGGVWGFDRPKTTEYDFSYAAPLIQAKFLIQEYQPNKWPGIGIVAGTFLPTGKRAFKAPGAGAFSYLIASQCFGQGEKLLIHANLGLSYLNGNNTEQTVATWGVGTQVKLYRGLHAVGEVFSGDPYVPGAGMAYQAGFRHFISDLVQVDMTAGKGFAGDTPLPYWYSAGIRLVTERFRKHLSKPGGG